MGIPFGCSCLGEHILDGGGPGILQKRRREFLRTGCIYWQALVAIPNRRGKRSNEYDHVRRCRQTICDWNCRQRFRRLCPAVEKDWIRSEAIEWFSGGDNFGAKSPSEAIHLVGIQER